MHHTNTKLSGEMQQCIDNCQSCHTVCLETISQCLEMGGRHAEASHIKLLQDCAQICATSADFLVRMSDHHPQVCGVCADICEACAESCDTLSEESGDFMAECAEICRKCAASCREMSSGRSTSASI